MEMLTVPVRVPVCVGVNVIWRVQPGGGARAEPVDGQVPGTTE